MTYNTTGKRIRTENLAGQATVTDWDCWSVTYNGENRLVRWQNVSPNSSTHNSSTPSLISMSYDRMGRRVTKNDQRFVYNGYLQVENFHCSPSTFTYTFIWDPTEPVATRPLVWNRSALGTQLSTLFYTHDGNKNVSEVIDFDNDVAAHYEYAPFGALTVSRGESSAANPFRFSSEYAEDDTATVYYNYRHYEPVMGRWMSRDMLAPKCGDNLYVFRQLDWLGLLDYTTSFIVYGDLETALSILRDESKVTSFAWGWDKVYPFKREEGWRKNKDCCEITGRAFEYYRRLKIEYKHVAPRYTIYMPKWKPASEVSDDAKNLYEALFQLVLEHEKGHVAIYEEYLSKLEETFTEEDSDCEKEEVLGYDVLERLIESSAEDKEKEIKEAWDKADAAYQEIEELQGRHQKWKEMKEKYESTH